MPINRYHKLTLAVCVVEEEEEEEDESDDDGMPIPGDSTAMGEESLEPPSKLARTDLFNSTHT